jgi:hypothetical protein
MKTRRQALAVKVQSGQIDVEGMDGPGAEGDGSSQVSL